MLTTEQIRSYRDEGYLVLERVFDADTVARMRAAIARLVDESRAVTRHDERFDLEPDHRAGAPRVRRIKQPHLLDPVFDEVMRHPALLAVLGCLLPAGVRIRGSKLNMKDAGGGAAVEWHQDWAFYPHTNDDVLAVGVMIDDCQLENGPLLVLPGTHRGPTYDHHDREGRFCGAMDPAACDVDFASAVPCTGPAGSISIHHARLIHGSAQNVSPDPRRLLLFEYTAADAWPLLGFGTLDEFDSRLLAGRPNIQPRMTDVPVRMPLPPAPFQGSIYENQATLKNRYFARKAVPA